MFISNFYSICKVGNVVIKDNRVVGRIKNYTTKVICDLEANKTVNKVSKKRKIPFISPSLTDERIMETNTVTGITIGKVYITWVKVSIKTITVLEWNGYRFPKGFGDHMDEPNLLKLAYDIRASLPVSDIYLMEKVLKLRRGFHRGHDIFLSSVLAVLLNASDTDELGADKVFFQPSFVLNKLHNLQLGDERISAKEIVKNKCKPFGDDSTREADIWALTNVDDHCVNSFMKSDFTKQEDLSLVLLLALSFIDVNIFKSQKSLEKLEFTRKS